MLTFVSEELEFGESRTAELMALPLGTLWGKN